MMLRLLKVFNHGEEAANNSNWMPIISFQSRTGENILTEFSFNCFFPLTWFQLIENLQSSDSRSHYSVKFSGPPIAEKLGLRSSGSLFREWSLSVKRWNIFAWIISIRSHSKSKIHEILLSRTLDLSEIIMMEKFWVSWLVSWLLAGWTLWPHVMITDDAWMR